MFFILGCEVLISSWTHSLNGKNIVLHPKSLLFANIFIMWFLLEQFHPCLICDLPIVLLTFKIQVIYLFKTSPIKIGIAIGTRNCNPPIPIKPSSHQHVCITFSGAFTNLNIGQNNFWTKLTCKLGFCFI
jgi:hypothetical protein